MNQVQSTCRGTELICRHHKLHLLNEIQNLEVCLVKKLVHQFVRYQKHRDLCPMTMLYALRGYRGSQVISLRIDAPQCLRYRQLGQIRLSMHLLRPKRRPGTLLLRLLTGQIALMSVQEMSFVGKQISKDKSKLIEWLLRDKSRMLEQKIFRR